jgi:hypothetical protein
MIDDSLIRGQYPPRRSNERRQSSHHELNVRHHVVPQFGVLRRGNVLRRIPSNQLIADEDRQILIHFELILALVRRKGYLRFRQTTCEGHDGAREETFQADFTNKVLDIGRVTERNAIFVPDGGNLWRPGYH